jgi:hypothetical protein
MPRYPKQTLWDLLGSDAPAFAMYCHNKATDNAKSICYMFENIDGLDLNADIVQQMVLPTLLADGVITQATIDRINAFLGNA